MGDVAKNSANDNCIILSPQELADLGVHIKSPVASTSTQKPSNHAKKGKKQKKTTKNSLTQEVKTDVNYKSEDDKQSKIIQDKTILNDKDTILNLDSAAGKFQRSIKDKVKYEKSHLGCIGTKNAKNIFIDSKGFSFLNNNVKPVTNTLNRESESESDDSYVLKPKRQKITKSKSINESDGGRSLLNTKFNDPEITDVQSENPHSGSCQNAQNKEVPEQTATDPLEIIETVNSSTNINNPKLMGNSLVTSKRGRKRKDINYSILESEDYFEHDQNRTDTIEQNKTPKKRGRPRKSSAEKNTKIAIIKEENYSLLDSGDYLEPNQIMTDTIEQNKTPKKRGRPRKSSTEINIKTAIIKEENYSLLESGDCLESNTKMPDTTEYNTVPRKRGRPRKSTVEKKFTTKKKEVNYSPIETDDSDELNTSEDDTIEQNKQRKKRSRPRKPPLEINNKTFEEESDLILDDDNIKNSEKTDLANDSEVKESGRYRWTGNTTKALNQLFCAIQDKNIENSEHNPLLGKNKGRGRPKINLSESEYKTGTSVCMVCNETIPNLKWKSHKRKVHYNLTWRKGDAQLDFSDEDLVKKILKDLLKERKYIKCNKCFKKYTKAKEFSSHMDLCSGVVNLEGFVTCAVCKKSLEKSTWQYHNYRQHNNLSWREGDPPLNLEDQDLVLKVLNNLYKARKPFHCEKCDQQKKSVLGYLSHKSICQKSEDELIQVKVECHLCGRKVLPVSMDFHLKVHTREKLSEVITDAECFNIQVNVTKKRRAATRALKVINKITGQVMEEPKYYIPQCDFLESEIKNILTAMTENESSLKCIFAGCSFCSNLVESMAEHMNLCEKKPKQYYVCKICLSCYEEETLMNEHIKDNHNKIYKAEKDKEFQVENEQVASDDDELPAEEDMEKKRIRHKVKQQLIIQDNSKVKQLIKPMFLIHPIAETPSLLLYRHTYLWTHEFCSTNYSDTNLFKYFRNTEPLQPLDCDLLNDYLPKSSQSCDIAGKCITVQEKPEDPNMTEIQFKKMELFEISHLYEGDLTIFCGGPVSALTWLPTPYGQPNKNQILAVAVFNSMNGGYTADKNYFEPCIIQFWDFEKLDCLQTDTPKPSLMFGLALTCGPVWHLEWCPSGCFDCIEEDTDNCRLGLLAVAASDSFVYIYSIDNIRDENDRGCIFKGKPVAKLQLELETSTIEGQAYYPTRISWSKAKNHRYLAVGYSTGLVGLYDLSKDNTLFQGKGRCGSIIVFPYRSFQAHFSSITALTLSHLGNGNDWLFSSSFDRTSTFWDLRTLTKVTATKRFTVSDGLWATHWPIYLVAEDESTCNDNTGAHVSSRTIRNFINSEVRNYTSAPSGIKTVSFSDWFNSTLNGTNGGDITTQFNHRLFCAVDAKRIRAAYKKCIFSLTKLVKKTDSNDLEATNYEDAVDKYKVAFLDYNLDKITNTPNSINREMKLDTMASWDLREYNLQGINKVVYNPNLQACSHFAAGYQAGFVRLRNVKFVNSFLTITS